MPNAVATHDATFGACRVLSGTANKLANSPTVRSSGQPRRLARFSETVSHCITLHRTLWSIRIRTGTTAGIRVTERRYHQWAITCDLHAAVCAN